MESNQNPWKAFIVLTKPFLYGGMSLFIIMLVAGIFYLPNNILVILLYPILCILPGIIIGYKKRTRCVKNSFDFKLKEYPAEFTKAVSYMKSSEGKKIFYKLATIISVVVWLFCIFVIQIPYRDSASSIKNWAISIIYILFFSNFSIYLLIGTVYQISMVRKWDWIKLHYKEYDIKNDPFFVINDDEAKIIKNNRVMMWDNDSLG